jgi:hypothetical protein
LALADSRFVVGAGAAQGKKNDEGSNKRIISNLILIFDADLVAFLAFLAWLTRYLM